MPRRRTPPSSRTRLKWGELYSDLAKAAFKPVELTFANLLGAK
jgi:hypothetical protein